MNRNLFITAYPINTEYWSSVCDRYKNPEDKYHSNIFKNTPHFNCISLWNYMSIFGVSEHSSLRHMEVKWKYQCINIKNNYLVITQNYARLCSVKEVLKFTASVFKLCASCFSKHNLQKFGEYAVQDQQHANTQEINLNSAWPLHVKFTMISTQCNYTLSRLKKNVLKLDLHGGALRVFYLSITYKMQRYTIFFIAVNALHVSGSFSAHHQELKTVHTASGIWQACLLLPLVVAARKLDIYQMLCTALSSWWRAEKLPETCRALTAIKNIV
jgi:hypothetical protein